MYSSSISYRVYFVGRRALQFYFNLPGRRIFSTKSMLQRNAPSSAPPTSGSRPPAVSQNMENGENSVSVEATDIEQRITKRIYKVVLTGGPCGGKTTGQDRLATFFENLGWKVYRVPETATIILKGGVRFSELSPEQVERFQEDLLLALMRIEDLYFHLAGGMTGNEETPHNVLIICDRGTMDGSAYIEPSKWQKILQKNSLNSVDLRDKRYDQIVHMVTAAVGAEHFYTTANNVARSEDTKAAAEIDMRTRQVWVGHPYVDIIDNQMTRNFEDKILKMIQVVCDRAGIQYGDRLSPSSKKRKFLVVGFKGETPKYQEFDVVHDYLSIPGNEDVQARVRKRGQSGKFCYTHTVRRIVAGERVETRMQISQREYEALKKHADPLRYSTKKKRRCFMHGQVYFQLDIYKAPIPRGLKSLMILETYTTDTSSEFVNQLPPFLQIEREITSDPQYSLFTLSLKK